MQRAGRDALTGSDDGLGYQTTESDFNSQAEALLGSYRSKEGEIKNDCCWFNKKRLIRFFIIWFILLLFYVVVGLLVVISEDTMPGVVKETVTNQFSEERAIKHVNYLSGTVGARPFGSKQNKNETVNYILNQLKAINESSTAKFGYPRIWFGIRDHKGRIPSNYPARKRDPIYWDSMRNILVKVLPDRTNGANYSTILLSAHYDTVTLSPGAYDDTSGVATALELINVFAHKEPYLNQLFVLFNNAEESGLLGATDFAVYDEEFKKVVAFFNSDSTPGKKPMLFRSTGSYLDFEYRTAPRPLAHVISNDLFKLGLVHSDTDFTIYSKLGNIPGLDFAFFSRRQSYHSMKDTYLTPGSLQFLGDNLYDLIEDILESPSLNGDKIPAQEDNVYFTVLDTIYVCYSRVLSFIIHLLLAVTFLVTFPLLMVYRFNVWKHSLSETTEPQPIVGTIKALLKILLGVLAGLFAGAAVALALRFYNATFYYSSVGLGVMTFMWPTLTGVYTIEWLFARREFKKKLTIDVGQKFKFWGVVSFWLLFTLITLPLSYMAGSTYLFFFFGLTALMGLVLHHLAHVFKLIQPVDDYQVEPTKVLLRRYAIWFGLFIVMNFIPSLLLVDVAYLLLHVVVADMNVLIGGPAISFFTVLVNMNFLPLARRAGNFGLLVCLLLVTSSTFFIISSATRPFTPEYPYKIYPLAELDATDTNKNPNVTELVMYVEDPYSLSLDRVANQTLGLPVTCSIRDLGPYYYLCTYVDHTRPKIIMPKVDLISQQSNGTHRFVNMRVTAPDSYVHSVSFDVTVDDKSKVSQILVNGHNIIDKMLFVYMFSNDNAWDLQVTLVGSTTKCSFTLVSEYTQIEHIPIMQKLINTLNTSAKWVTFVGTGAGLLQVTTDWDF